MSIGVALLQALSREKTLPYQVHLLRGVSNQVRTRRGSPTYNKSEIDKVSHKVPHRAPSVCSPDNCCCRKIPPRVNDHPNYL